MSYRQKKVLSKVLRRKGGKEDMDAKAKRQKKSREKISSKS